MRCMRLATVLAVLFALGCAGEKQTASIPTRDLPAAPQPGAQSPDVPALPDSMETLAELRKPIENEFVSADDAVDCPMIKVTTPEGKTDRIQPGRAGYVTVVVAWTMDTRNGKAAVLHVNGLVRKYGQFGVRAVGLVEKTPKVESAPEFAMQQRLAMPLYYDDLRQTALRTLADKAGAQEERAVPAIFLVDRRLKLRFYRPGFRYSMWSVMENGRKIDHWDEDVPQDQTIEHYLEEVLKEQWGQ